MIIFLNQMLLKSINWNNPINDDEPFNNINLVNNQISLDLNDNSSGTSVTIPTCDLQHNTLVNAPCTIVDVPPNHSSPLDTIFTSNCPKVISRISFVIMFHPQQIFHWKPLLPNKSKCLLRVFLTNVIENQELKSFYQAMKSIEWHDAMAKEIQILESNNTWSLCSLLEGKSPIGCKRVYNIKYQADDSIERYKSPLVAQGYIQIEGIDYYDTFALVENLVNVYLLSIVAIKNWSMHQLGVNNVFSKVISMKKYIWSSFDLKFSASWTH